jgi:adenylate kinase/nucleoside 2-deoxyribosyltransferase
MQKWIVTGVSGSGRIELLQELKTHSEQIGKKVVVHDVGAMIEEECSKHRIKYSDKHVLNLDRNLLKVLRTAALKEANLRIIKMADVDMHFIGVHATFRWKSRLIPGMSFQDVLEIKPDGLLNIINDIKSIYETNSRNPKWDERTIPNPEETQYWMMEEEFVTEVIGEVINKPMYLVARKHNIDNLSDLFFSNKKKIYLSYPITAVRKENPELLMRIQSSILKDLEKLFVVFDPLTIKDIGDMDRHFNGELPASLIEFDHKAKGIIKARTIERDFQFIDQSDAVAVFYMTEKLSPGVLSEIAYAHRTAKPVFMVFPYQASPFIEDMTTAIYKTPEELMDRLRVFSTQR